MHTEEYTEMIIQISTLLDIEHDEVTKFLELMLDGYNFEDAVNGCSLTTDECKLVLSEIQKRKPKE
ncbi:MAG: hypothetical protein P8K73_00345 [Methylophilaceae bacterium]|jgi:hypothetical protein|nr:hypothetical protein [Methylophilaceae bacterium]